VPLITTAILLVFVFVVDADTAVDASIVPVATGKVSVPDPATSGALIVMAPLVFPATEIELMLPPYLLVCCFL
jgi:hypothetical protein